MSLDHNVVTKIIQVMTSPCNIRALTKAYSKSLMHKNTKDVAANESSESKYHNCTGDANRLC